MVQSGIWAVSYTHLDVYKRQIYAGVNGYLDAFPVDRVSAFEEGLLALLRASHPDLLDAIRASKDLSDDSAKKLKSIVDAYAKNFA